MPDQFMDYSEYKLEEFLVDEAFRDWVFDPGPTSCAFWEKWLSANPSKKNTVLAAKEILLCLKFHADGELDEREQEELLKSILAKRSL